MADPNGTRPPGSTKVPSGMAKVARVAPIVSNPSLGSVSSTSGGELVVDSNRLAGGVRQKKSSFQITSVTVGSRLSNDGGEDSADDLDESHTEDLSSDVLDVSKTTDYECSSEDAFSSIKDDGGGSSSVVHLNQTLVNVTSTSSQSLNQQQPAVTMFTTSTTTTSNPSSNVSVTVVEAANMPMSVVQHPEIQWQNRFRVVKIETSEPFRRGRWLCMDFLDPPPASTAQSDIGDRDLSSGGGCVGSGNSSGTGSMPHGESLIMETAAAGMLQQQHPVAASWSADSSSAIAAMNQAVANAGYGQETMTHGMTYASGMMDAPLYPVSIILQTQQQGNLDFTNTALHMQGRTAHYPRPTHVNPNPQPPPPNPQQQQPGTMTTAPTVVAPPGSGVIPPQANVQTRDYIQQQPDLQAVTHNTAIIQQHQMATQTQEYIHPNSVVPTMVQMDHNVPQTEYVTNPNPLPPVSNPNSQQTIIFPAAVTSTDYGILAQQTQNVVGSVPVVGNQSQPSTTATVVREQMQQTFQQQPPVLPNLSGAVQVATDSIVASSQDGAPLSSAAPSQSSGVQAQSITTAGAGGHYDSTTNAAATGTTLSPPVLEASGGEEGEGESASGASTVAIDNKIEQAMDLVKSHLMFAVREEVDVLKEKITELMDRINQLEYENNILKASASPETLAKLSSSSSQPPNTSTT